MALWRVRAEIDDEPGRLAALAGALAEQGANVFGLSVQPDASGPVDEFFVEVPPEVGRYRLVEAVTVAGGRRVTVLPAEPHDLLDTPTNALVLAARLLADPESLPEVLTELLFADEGAWEDWDPADGDEGEWRDTPAPLPHPETGEDRTSLALPVYDGRRVVLHRAGLPFTLTEAARAVAMVELLDTYRDAAEQRPAVPSTGAVTPAGAVAPAAASRSAASEMAADLAAQVAETARVAPAAVGGHHAEEGSS
ncbi:hypothetical protein [Allostreptomyces psammosilenae]|uniref:ACT domain-containing protein n=1 Tax=Allostreptomyces psammosilenae TaxID=1892865 RepID=A0A852ZUH3_9ACTN|nr:hypothetical protein [Allostreptomyces psammosilenae]NYI06043.1 hypothetical protein [Allostreptomyces psammosilenae]